MKTHQKEILLYYNPESQSDKQCVAHARTLVPHVKAYAYGMTPSTTTSWQIIVKALGLSPKEMLNKAHPFYQAHIRGRDFDDEGWLNILSRHSYLIKSPIAVRGGRAVFCQTPTDIYRLAHA